MNKYYKDFEEFKHYSKRIRSWVLNRSMCEEVIGISGAYNNVTREVQLSATSSEFTKGHEYGHAFWHDNSKKKVSVLDFFEYALLLSELSEEEFKEEIGKMGEAKELIPFTDYLSSLFKVPGCYYQHSKEYWSKMNKRAPENEAFASFFGYLYEGNYRSFKKIKEYFPKFFNSCLDLIEEGLY